MTWLVKDVHECDVPDRPMRALNPRETYARVGAVWRCDECGQHWRAEGSRPWTRWELISERAARRWLKKLAKREHRLAHEPEAGTEAEEDQ